MAGLSCHALKLFVCRMVSSHQVMCQVQLHHPWSWTSFLLRRTRRTIRPRHSATLGIAASQDQQPGKLDHQVHKRPSKIDKRESWIIESNIRISPRSTTEKAAGPPKSRTAFHEDRHSTKAHVSAITLAQSLLSPRHCSFICWDDKKITLVISPHDDMNIKRTRYTGYEMKREPLWEPLLT